jgi:hypothetical protein
MREMCWPNGSIEILRRGSSNHASNMRTRNSPYSSALTPRSSPSGVSASPERVSGLIFMWMRRPLNSS